mmetsp:Transcript_48931/g.147410  ORF Transcript_48931/g.147410 Transcript_48931/m.147410 type:complete len:340 (+) Transcript_48931:475-1494(+)
MKPGLVFHCTKNFLFLLKQTLHPDHSLFPQLQCPPHPIKLVVIPLDCYLIQRLVVVRRQLDFNLVGTVARPPVVDSSVRTQKHEIEPVGLANQGQYQIIELDLQHQGQRRHSNRRAEHEEERLAGAPLNQSLECDGLSRLLDLVVVRLHVRHDLAGLLTHVLRSGHVGIFPVGHVRLALDLGLGRAGDLTPNPREGHDVQTEGGVVRPLRVGRLADGGGGAGGGVRRGHRLDGLDGRARRGAQIRRGHGGGVGRRGRGADGRFQFREGSAELAPVGQGETGRAAEEVGHVGRVDDRERSGGAAEGPPRGRGPGGEGIRPGGEEEEGCGGGAWDRHRWGC